MDQLMTELFQSPCGEVVVKVVLEVRKLSDNYSFSPLAGKWS